MIYTTKFVHSNVALTLFLSHCIGFLSNIFCVQKICNKNIKCSVFFNKIRYRECFFMARAGNAMLKINFHRPYGGFYITFE